MCLAAECLASGTTVVRTTPGPVIAEVARVSMPRADIHV